METKLYKQVKKAKRDFTRHSIVGLLMAFLPRREGGYSVITKRIDSDLTARKDEQREKIMTDQQVPPPTRTADDDLENRFNHHPPATRDTAIKHETIREICRNAAYAVKEIVPPGREQALALTKLEEAMFWGNAGVARIGDPKENVSS